MVSPLTTILALPKGLVAVVLVSVPLTPVLLLHRAVKLTNDPLPIAPAVKATRMLLLPALAVPMVGAAGTVDAVKVHPIS